MPRLPMPDVPPGNLRTLVLELHSLHGRAGWPSCRDIARKREFSHTAVHVLFTKTTAEAPKLTVLLDVVETLCKSVRRINDIDVVLDRFEELWVAADSEPFTSAPAPQSDPDLDEPEPTEAADGDEIGYDAGEYGDVEDEVYGIGVVKIENAGLDPRLDLMQMSPVEFEHFVRQLFEVSGADDWTTELSTDGRFDAVAINHDPITGGSTVVEAKRYRNAVGVSQVRQLAGVIEETRAGRGVLITTSWFSTGCYALANENGRIELIDGPRLVYLAKERLGVDVLVSPHPALPEKIVCPDPNCGRENAAQSVFCEYCRRKLANEAGDVAR